MVVEPNKHISLSEMIYVAYLLSVIVIDKGVAVCCIYFRCLLLLDVNLYEQS